MSGAMERQFAERWRMHLLREHIWLTVSERKRKRVEKARNEEKRLRLIRTAWADFTPGERERIFNQVMDLLPRPARRALGDRTYSQSGRFMAVPKERR